METRLQGLADASARIFAAQSLEETLRLITEAARDLVGAHQAVTSLTVGSDWSQAIQCVLLSDKYAAWRAYEEVPTGKGIYARICADNRPMRLTQADLTAHPAWRGFGAAKDRHPPMRGWLAVPLVARDGANLGLVQLSDRYEGDFDAGDEAILVQLARLGALAVENQRLLEAREIAERRFEGFATLGSEVLWETDAQHRYSWFFAKGSFRLDRSPDEFIGKTRWEAMNVDPRDPFWAAHIADLMAHRPLRGFEYQAELGDGKLHTVRLNAEPQFDAAGNFTGYRGTTQDVTELRAAEAAAKANERRFHDFAELASDVLWESDENHLCTFIAARPGWRTLHPLSFYLGKTRWDSIGADSTRPEWQAHIAELDAHRPIRRFEYSVTYDDGTVRHLQVNGQPRFDASGKFLGYRGATSDVTGLRAAEQAARAAEAAARSSEDRFRQFAAIASDWVWETDAQHRLSFFAGHRGVLARRPYGMTRWEIARADASDPAWRGHIADLEARRPFRGFEYSHSDESGRRRYISVSGEPLFGPDGEFLGYRGTATDLTAQREAEAEARKAAELYRAIVETAIEGVWIVDGERRTVFVNTRMAEMLGYAPDEMLGRDVSDFRPPEDRGTRDERWARRALGMSEQRESRFKRRDGTEFWAQVSAAPMKDANGKFTGALGMVSDITARKEAEAALKASEQRFRDFAEVGVDWLWETDREHRIVILEGPAPVAAGFAFGKRRWEFGGVDPESPTWRGLIRDMNLHVPFRNLEYKVRGVDGSDRHLALSGNPVFDAAGTFLGYRGTTRDVTAQRAAEAMLKASEERFRDFAQVASDWMWETDDRHRFSYFSPSRDASQPDASGNAIGKTRWEFAAGDATAPDWQAHIADLDAHRPFRGFEYTYRRPDGSVGNYVVSGVPVFAEDGAFAGYRGTTSDITAQRAAEAAALESERRFRTIVETAHEGIWMLDTERRTIYVNPRMAEMLGYAPAEMQGRHHWEFMAPEDRDAARETRRQRVDDAVQRAELRYLRKDGTPLWVIVASNVIVDPAGDEAAILGMVTDITDRKASEEALRAAEALAIENERRYRRIVETASEGIWILDRDAVITYANRRMAEMMRCEPADLIGRSITDFEPPDRREEVKRLWNERRGGKTIRLEARHLRMDGSEFWAIISSTPIFDARGDFTGAITMFVDISDRKAAEAAAAESEARFRDFAEIASDWMWESDREHRLTFISGTPLASDKNPMGRTRWEIAGVGADDPMWRAHIAELEVRKPFRDFEFTIPGKSGRTHYLVASGRPVFDDRGDFAGYRGVTTNRTQQREAEAAARASERQFRQIVETAQEGIWVLDSEWRTNYVNPRMADMLGYAPEEILGRPHWDFLADPAERERASRIRNDRSEAATQQREWRYRRKDGRAIWTLVTSSPVYGEDGVRSGILGMLADITDRKAAEEEVTRAKRELDAILANTSDGVAIFDNEWRYTYLNEPGERITGLRRAEIVGVNYFEKYALAPGNIFLEAYRQAKRDQCSVAFVAYSSFYKAWHEVRALPHAEGVTAFFRDVTAERERHLALAESERKLRAALENNQSILESISDGFVALDNEWRFTFINPAAERIWSLRAADLLGKTLLDSLNVDRTNAFHVNYLESKRTGDPAAFTAYSDIFGKWIEVRGYPHPGGFTIFFDDVSEVRRAHRELLQSNQRFEAAREMNERLFETSLDLICITDSVGNFVEVNPGACKQFGYAKAEIIGRNASEFIDDVGILATREAMRAARRSQVLHTFEAKCRRKDGGWVPVHCSVAWSEREHKFFLIGRDMSEQIAQQERLNRSQRLEAIGQLTGGIAHDFNNLLTVIMGNSDALARGLADRENLRRRAELSLEAARRAAELTAQLLAFARRQTLAPKAVEANKLVQDMHELVRRTLGAQIEIVVMPGEKLWLCKVDSTQLETALLNLALNARDAMPGGGRLTIATSNRTIAARAANGAGDLAPGDYVAIEVSDSGAGMTPEIMARAFEPFFTTKDIGKGSGLGLAMVYGFVKQSGGGVAIESAPGRGTKVTLHLPRAAESKPAAAQPPAADGQPLPGGAETILVVEDDPAVRELVTDQLRALGYRVLVAGNGATARNILFGGENVDLLFTDVMMPGGVTGTQLAAEAEKRLPGLKILFTTGYSEVPALANARRGVALLRKPYKTRDLARTVRETLDAVA